MSHRPCPWWLGPLLCCPLRRLIEDPATLLGPFVRPGMTVLEPGCGMGYFTLPLAQMVGPEGHVVCVDLQQRMIEGLKRRARRARLLDRIESSVCTADDLGLSRWNSRIDLAVAIHMVHEVTDQRRLLSQIRDVLRPAGALLIIEPKGHVSAAAFQETLSFAADSGFTLAEEGMIKREQSALLRAV